jgi:glutaredoxin 3
VRELYATGSCPFCAEMRERLDWDGEPYVEYDVEADADARARWRALSAGQAIVPVLVEDGRVLEIGWQGRGCTVAPG